VRQAGNTHLQNTALLCQFNSPHFHGLCFAIEFYHCPLSFSKHPEAVEQYDFSVSVLSSAPQHVLYVPYSKEH
jgi:hypothetical protein